MARNITFGAGALNLTPLDWEGNSRIIRACIEEAKSRNVTILCLPELAISGYGCEDAFLSPYVSERSLQRLIELAPSTRGLVCAVGLPIRFEEVLYNAAALLVDGEIKGFACKQFLADDGIHYEPRWFTPWPRGKKATLHVSGKSLPLGDIIFEVDGVRIGFEVCEDAWVKDRPGAELAKRGVDVILNPSASHFALGKYEIRKRLVTEGSKSFGAVYVFANHLGNEAGRAIYDGDCLIALNGEIFASGPRFSFKEFTITEAVVPIDREYAKGKEFHLPLAKGNQKPDTAHKTGWETSKYLRFEEILRAVSLALFDYLRKTKSHGFVVSLSGGADSGAVSSLASSMVALGTHELGIGGFKARLPYIPNLSGDTATKITSSLLTCVYQSLPNSSDTTRHSAKMLAESIGAKFFEFKLDEVLDTYQELFSKATGEKLSWESDDIALQNIQSRVRVPALWLLANKNKALLLATSNRSEASVGYCTMDGDTSGGLSPIAGIDKYFLREFLKWLEKDGAKETGGFPGLHEINSLQPTAELRPSSMKQTDEKDLMPYEVLSFIEREAICNRRSPEEVSKLTEKQFDGRFKTGDIHSWVNRFYQLWAASQWKRERLAPSFHLDDYSVDSRTWCRYPILSGVQLLSL